MAEPQTSVLVVEDEESIRQGLCDVLAFHGMQPEGIERGDDGLRRALANQHQLLILDVMLPGMTGIEVCQRLRGESDVPIVMITARGEEADRVMGLELGADDYLPKPFSPRELLARIRALVRRSRGRAGPPAGRRVAVGALTVDAATREARLDGRALDLTSYEFSLLYVLAERAGRVLSREQLMELARGSADEAFDRSIDVHISRLRAKLGQPLRQRLRTVRGAGYLFTEAP